MELATVSWLYLVDTQGGALYRMWHPSHRECLTTSSAQYYWSVVLVLTNRPFAVEVIVNKLSGAVKTSVAEGQFGRRGR